MVHSLLADLYDTDVEDEAFSVGIAGKWGVGKSSFINLLRNSISKKGGLIVDLVKLLLFCETKMQKS